MLQKSPAFQALHLKYLTLFKPLSFTDVAFANIHINTVQNHRRAKYLNWGYHAHPCLLFKQAKKPHPPPKPLRAPKSGSFAKSSLTLNIHITGEEKANSGKVQDWRQREPHVRNSFLITGNALDYCIKMLWFIFIFLKVNLCLISHANFHCVLIFFALFFPLSTVPISSSSSSPAFLSFPFSSAQTYKMALR